MTGTPSSKWQAEGEKDPHGSRYDCGRQEIAMGNLSDKDLALWACPSFAKEGYRRAAADRIMWLSNRLDEIGSNRSLAASLDQERAALLMGDLTDDELANAQYMEAGDIVIQTAVKERMRWLSRQLHKQAVEAAQPNSTI